MEYKSNKIYLLLEKPIFKSDKLVFNSITGYNIIKTVQVASEEDIITFMRNNNVAKNDVILFKVNSNCEYYISRNFVAVKDTDDYINILLFFLNNNVVVQDVNTLYTWKSLIIKFNISRIIITLYFIGHLSKPDGESSLVSRIAMNDMQDVNNIKLPIFA